MQMAVEKDKGNEIVVAPKLLQCVDLHNKVVIGDAMHTQRQLSIQIVAAEAVLFGLSKATRRIRAEPSNSYSLIRNHYRDWGARPGISAAPKPLKNKLGIWKNAKLLSVRC